MLAPFFKEGVTGIYSTEFTRSTRTFPGLAFLLGTLLFTT